MRTARRPQPAEAPREIEMTRGSRQSWMPQGAVTRSLRPAGPNRRQRNRLCPQDSQANRQDPEPGRRGGRRRRLWKGPDRGIDPPARYGKATRLKTPLCRATAVTIGLRNCRWSTAYLFPTAGAGATRLGGPHISRISQDQQHVGGRHVERRDSIFCERGRMANHTFRQSELRLAPALSSLYGRQRWGHL